MDKERMLITGGHALEGEVRVSGGKNTAVAVIPATLLCDEPCTIENLPDIEDVHALADILTELGAKVDYEPGRCMRVDPRPAEGTRISYRNAQRLRASYYLLGALLGVGAACLFMWLGFWKTLFILAMAGLGAFLFGVDHKMDAIKNLINKLFPSNK